MSEEEKEKIDELNTNTNNNSSIDRKVKVEIVDSDVSINNMNQDLSGSFSGSGEVQIPSEKDVKINFNSSNNDNIAYSNYNYSNDILSGNKSTSPKSSSENEAKPNYRKEDNNYRNDNGVNNKNLKSENDSNNNIDNNKDKVDSSDNNINDNNKNNDNLPSNSNPINESNGEKGGQNSENVFENNDADKSRKTPVENKNDDLNSLNNESKTEDSSVNNKNNNESIFEGPNDDQSKDSQNSSKNEPTLENHEDDISSESSDNGSVPQSKSNNNSDENRNQNESNQNSVNKENDGLKKDNNDSLNDDDSKNEQTEMPNRNNRRKDDNIPNQNGYRKNNLGNRRSNFNNNNSDAAEGDGLNNENNEQKDKPESKDNKNGEKSSKDNKSKSVKDKKDNNITFFGTITTIAMLPKIIIIVGAISIFFIVLFIFNFAAFIEEDTEARRDRSTGAIVRTNPQDSYNCIKTSPTEFPIYKSTLTKDEFIKLVNEYEPSEKFKKYYQLFKENAGAIYDLGIEKNLNPELVITRAFAEGFSPEANPSKTGDYNYWGIGCGNGGGKTTKNCRGYKSFLNGVEGFYDLINSWKPQNIYDIMSKYAYLGDAWYYPGNSDLGGCYYSKWVVEQQRLLGYNERASQVENICKVGSEDGTDEKDHEGYMHYQVATVMTPWRKRIFKVSGEASETVCTCKTPSTNLGELVINETKTLKNITSEDGGSARNIFEKNCGSIDSFNEGLLALVLKDGPGTRKAVVDAAIYYVNAFAMYGYNVPYSYYGGHYYYFTNADGKRINYNADMWYGLNPYVGERLYDNGHEGYTRVNDDGTETTYHYMGYDCSGFVGWAFTNGGITRELTSASGYKDAEEVKGHVYKYGDPNYTKGQPGDVLSSPKHVALIIYYDENNGPNAITYNGHSGPFYVTIEEAGKGLAVKKYFLDSSYTQGFSLVDMSYYYENAKTPDFENKFRNGLIK